MTDSARRRTIAWANPAELARARRMTTGLDFFRRTAAGEIPPPPLYNALDLRLAEAAEEYSVVEAEAAEFMYNPVAIVHGGMAGALIDSAAGVALQSTLPEGPRPGTIRLSVDYARPITAETGLIRCEGRLVKGGRQIGHSDATVTDSQGRLLARGQAIFAISPPEAWKQDEPGPEAGIGEIDPAWKSIDVTWEDPQKLRDAAAASSGSALAEAWAAKDLPPPPMAATLGFDLSAVEHGKASFTCRPTTMHYNPMGSAHGGLAFTLLDSASGIAVFTTLDPGMIFTTINTTVEFYRPITEETGLVTCTGQVVRAGRRIAVADGHLTDAEGRLYARAQTTCMILPA